MASGSSDLAAATADERHAADGAPTEKPVRPPEPHKPRELKDAAKNAERQAVYTKLHDAWKVEHAAWEVRCPFMAVGPWSEREREQGARRESEKRA